MPEDLSKQALISRRYRIQSELGRGGMGVVYRVTDRLNSTTVALKQVLRATETLGLTSIGADKNTDSYRISLAQEFRTLASVRHPNVISVLDYGFDHLRQPYFTMDFLENSKSFSEALRTAALTVKVHYLLQVLQALSYLHRRGIVHRDLKPANVLIAEEQVKVLDFGLASGGWDQEDPEDEQIAGTLAYMSPEVIQGMRPTRPADLYAVGIMAYELLTGEHPFDVDNAGKLITDILFTDPDMQKLERSVADNLPAPKSPKQITVEFDMPTQVGDPKLGQKKASKPAAQGDEEQTTFFDKSLSARVTPADTNRKDDTPATEFYDPSTIEITDGLDLTITRKLGDIYVPPTLTSVVAKLLVKDPQYRYQNAEDVIADLCMATGQPLPEESVAIRESFLQAARFVGREYELTQLTNALEHTLDEQGSSWLIGGESGVGKSRLLEELRILALVRGALVLRGRSVSGGGLPYQLFRDPLRRLILNTDISNRDAAILSDIVPDIAELLDRKIDAAPAVEDANHQQRLISTITSMFQKNTQPTVLILEDLQWAQESLIVLRALNEMVHQLPLLIVGNFRQEERPTLPEELPEMHYLKLERLTKDSVYALTESMLGEAGRQQHLLELLHRETEGNALFLVEVVRTLADEAGRLEDIGRITLPQHVLAGGIQNVIKLRLDQVPQWGRSLLQLAAVAGRDLDLDVLERLKGDVNLETWLTVCANSAVLEVHDGHWTFTHEKLREAGTQLLGEERVPQAHRMVAVAIEATYPDDPAQAAILMQHWHMAGDSTKELQYAQIAGELALHSSIYDEALEHLSRALTLLENQPLSVSEKDLQRATTLTKLGTAWQYKGDYPTAHEQISAALALFRQQNSQAGIVQALNALAEVAERRGEFAEANQFANESLALSQSLNDVTNIARALNRLGMVQYQQGNYPAAAEQFEQALRYAEQGDAALERATIINNLGLVAYVQDNHAEALERFNQVLGTTQASGDRRKSATILLNLGSVSASTGNFTAAKGYFEESLQTSREIGERRLIALVLENLGIAAFENGEFSDAERYFQEGLFLARSIQNRHGTATTLANLGDLAVAQADHERAAAYYREALQIARDIEAAPIAMNAIAGLAELEQDPQRAITWLGLVLHHPATFTWRRQMVDALLKQRGNALNEADVSKWTEAGKSLSLDEVLQSLNDNTS